MDNFCDFRAFFLGGGEGGAEVSFFFVVLAEAVRTMVVPIMLLIPTMVVPIRRVSVGFTD